jgi:hypothetical protein
MIKALIVELYKTRRKKIGWVVAAFILTQLFWIIWSMSRMKADDEMRGWMVILYQFPLLNAIMMPVMAAVIASRLGDLEHKGQAYRLLRTIAPAGLLFDVKFFTGALYMLTAALLQLGVILASGYFKGFEGSPPFERLFCYLFFTTAVNLSILLLQQILSLLFTNQMVALSAGLIGAFAGLFSLFFPQSLQKLILWGYYGVLMIVRLDWNPDTRISHYSWTPIDWPGFILLGIFFSLLYGLGRFLFTRKEV